MAGRRRAAVGFRPGSTAAGPTAPSRRQAVAMLAGLLVVAAVIAVAAYLVKPSRAHSFQLFYGTTFINDDTGPVAVDLASGKPTVRLRNAFNAVSAKTTGELSVYPLPDGGALMLDTTTGEFNMVDDSGLVIKTSGGGVRLPTPAGASTSTAVPSGSSAYIVQTGAGGTSVYLVGPSTVDSAIGARTDAQPRAYATLGQPTITGSAAAVSANGNLWLLTGSGSTHRVVELAVPAGSNAGAALHRSGHGTVSGAAALASATRTTAGTGGDVVAAASSSAIRVFDPHGTARRLPVRGLGAVDSIVSATDLHGRFAFLYHGSAGWSLVTAPVTATGGATVHRLAAIGTGIALARPAASNGRLYTMAVNDQGQLWQIGPAGTVAPISGASTYPLLPGEKSDLSRSEILADGSRVIFNSRANYEAEAVFTDGSRPPAVIDKHAAVQLDANTAAALAGLPQPGPTNTASNAPKTTHPSQAVNDKLNCKTTTQVPHIPTAQALQIGSRSVQLHWTYPTLDTQDCAPTTYTVTAKALSAGAPAAPGRVTVQSQVGTNLSGLFPDTEYQIVVTAYINGRGTASIPLTLRTTVEGPAAPTGVRTTVDRSGNWIVHWNSCGGVSAGCVPAANWQVIPRFCDGVGLSSPPPVRQFIGDPTQHSFAFTYRGDGALLGRGLSFQIEGVGTKGTIGTAAADHLCSYSWTRPVAADISVTASAPPVTTGQHSTSTTVAVRFAKTAAHDLGGVRGTLTYQLLSGGRVVTTSGATTKATATLGGIVAGRRYEVRVIAAPPHHAGAAVTIGPVPVQPAIARWPIPTVAARFADSTFDTGALTVTVSLPAGTNTRGERFDLVNSRLVCGNTGQSLNQGGLIAGRPFTISDIDRSAFNSTTAPCRVTVQLVQDAATSTDPPLYGAGASASATSSAVAIDPPQLGSGQDDFAANWVSNAPPGQPQIAVSYQGADPFIGTGFVTGWSMVAATRGTSNCGSSTSGPIATIAVDPGCVTTGGTFTVTISFDYFGTHHSTTATVTGSQPAPVDPTQLSFSAAWSGGPGDVVDVHYSGRYDDATLTTLTWTETVTSSGSPGASCGHATVAPSTSVDIELPIDLAACPAITTDRSGNPVASRYTVEIHFTDPNYGVTGDYKPAVTGTPPP